MTEQEANPNVAPAEQRRWHNDLKSWSFLAGSGNILRIDVYLALFYPQFLWIPACGDLVFTQALATAITSASNRRHSGCEGFAGSSSSRQPRWGEARVCAEQFHRISENWCSIRANPSTWKWHRPLIHAAILREISSLTCLPATRYTVPFRALLMHTQRCWRLRLDAWQAPEKRHNSVSFQAANRPNRFERIWGSLIDISHFKPWIYQAMRLSPPPPNDKGSPTRLALWHFRRGG